MLIPAATIAAPPSAQCGLSALPSFGDTLASSMSIMSIAEPSQSPGQIVVSTKASLAPNTLLNAQIRMQVDSEDISADPSKSSTNIFTMPSLVGEMVNPTNGHLALATPPRLSPKVAAKKNSSRGAVVKRRSRSASNTPESNPSECSGDECGSVATITGAARDGGSFTECWIEHYRRPGLRANRIAVAGHKR